MLLMYWYVITFRSWVNYIIIGKLITDGGSTCPCGGTIHVPSIRLTADKITKNISSASEVEPVERLSSDAVIAPTSNATDAPNTGLNKKSTGRNKNNSDEQKFQKALKYVKKGNNRSVSNIL